MPVAAVAGINSIFVVRQITKVVDLVSVPALIIQVGAYIQECISTVVQPRHARPWSRTRTADFAPMAVAVSKPVKDPIELLLNGTSVM